jgi:hypothetical protein
VLKRTLRIHKAIVGYSGGLAQLSTKQVPRIGNIWILSFDARENSAVQRLLSPFYAHLGDEPVAKLPIQGHQHLIDGAVCKVSEVVKQDSGRDLIVSFEIVEPRPWTHDWLPAPQARSH